jgi:hypothetical protein
MLGVDGPIVKGITRVADVGYREGHWERGKKLRKILIL